MRGKIYNYKLTKEDINVLKRATDVYFSYYKGESNMRVTLKKEVKGFGEIAKEFEIPVNAMFDLYAPDSEYQHDEREVVSCSAYTGLYDRSTAGTAIRFMRAGDEVTLYWLAGNGNGYLASSRCSLPVTGTYDARIYHDELKLTVHRGDKDYTFFIEDSLCPDNSARMVKFTQW